MSETPKLELPLVQASQSQKHVTVNEAFLRIDALSKIELTSIGQQLPPGTPAEGDLHFVGDAPSGDWSGEASRLALFLNGGWLFFDPRSGWQGWDAGLGVPVTFDGLEWIAGGGAFSPNGAGFVHRTIEVDHSVGSGGSSTVATAIPAQTLVYGVTGRVITDVGGATGFDIGVSGSADRYGSGYGVVSGSWARGLTGSPLAYYSDTDLVISAVGGNFDGTGSIRLAVHLAELTLPRI